MQRAIVGMHMAKSQWHHYLPEVYLKGFATLTGEVWRYDRSTRELKALPTRVIGAEKDLYATFDGEQLSHEIETKWFNALDGRFGPIKRTLQERGTISPAETVELANFAAYLKIRTPAFIREVEQTIRLHEAQLGVPREKIQYHSRPRDDRRDTYVVNEERSDVVTIRRAQGSSRNEALQLLVNVGMTLARGLLGLGWTLLCAPSGRSFIVGDNPFVVVPPKSHRSDLEGVGPMVAGAVTLVPLSATHCLRMASVTPLASPRTVDASVLRIINACQVLNSERFIFGPSDALLNRLTAEHVSAPGFNPAEIVIRQAGSVSDASRTLLHSFTKSKIPPEWAERIRVG